MENGQSKSQSCHVTNTEYSIAGRIVEVSYMCVSRPGKLKGNKLIVGNNDIYESM